jgi:hypothetical protein
MYCNIYLYYLKRLKWSLFCHPQYVNFGRPSHLGFGRSLRQTFFGFARAQLGRGPAISSRNVNPSPETLAPNLVILLPCADSTTRAADHPPPLVPTVAWRRRPSLPVSCSRGSRRTGARSGRRQQSGLLGGTGRSSSLRRIRRRTRWRQS